MTKFIGKIAGVALVVAFAFTATSSASALSAADIELLVSLGVIPADKAAAAMALATGGSSSSASCAVYTRDLTLGSTGADVVSLQTMLESKGHLVIPTGVSKGYFGALTQSSLAKYQASMGIAPASGYFGPITRASITCSTTGGDDMDGDEDDDMDLSGSEASLSSFNANSKHSNEDLEEGETDMVLSVDFDVDDGDARLERVDVSFEAVDETGEDEPWKQLESVAVYLDGEKIAEMDVDDEDDWSRESSNATNITGEISGGRSYKVRFSGLSEFLEEGSEPEIEIEVTVQSPLDSGDLPQGWAVWIPDAGIRAVDGQGIDQTTGEDSEEKYFDIEAAQDGTVDFQSSDDDPDASILVVNTADKSSEFEVFRFEIDNEDADIFLNTLIITATTSDDDIDNVLSELMVEIDGQSYDFDTSSTTAPANNGQYTFDFEDNDDEVSIDEDETVTVIVKAVFNQMVGNYAEGTQVVFGVGDVTGTAAGTAEGQQSGDASTISGSATGATHALRAAGVMVEGLSDSFTTKYIYGDGSSVNAERGFFTLKVEVTALEDDVWILDTVGTTTGGAAGSFGFVYSITGDTYTGTSSALIKNETSNTETNNRHKVNDGSSETFTLEIQLDPDTDGNFGVQLEEVSFSTTSAAVSTSTFDVPNDDEFDTDNEFING